MLPRSAKNLRSIISTQKRLITTSIPVYQTPKPTSIPPSSSSPSTSKPKRKPSNFSRPSPPPLPPADQAEFDALLKSAQTVGATPLSTVPSASIESALDKANENAGEHRDLRRKPKPEFEGDVNPLTGERGGPKRDPFGAGTGDWQYGGRVTDF